MLWVGTIFCFISIYNPWIGTYYANIFGTNHWLFYYIARAIKLEIFSTGYDDDVAILSFFVGNFLDLHIREFPREFVEYLHLQ